MKSERRTRSEIRVLVVDDEPDIRELLNLTLVRMGLVADCVGSVTEAKHLLEKSRYQLCLTDMRMPDGEGLDLVRHISEHCADLPVAVITAHGSMENAISALKAGAFDYLAKPVSLDQLRVLVKSAIGLPARSDDNATSANESGTRHDRTSRPQSGAGLYFRRVRQRQGIGGQSDSPTRRPSRSAFHPG